LRSLTPAPATGPEALPPRILGAMNQATRSIARRSKKSQASVPPPSSSRLVTSRLWSSASANSSRGPPRVAALTTTSAPRPRSPRLTQTLDPGGGCVFDNEDEHPRGLSGRVRLEELGGGGRPGDAVEDNFERCPAAGQARGERRVVEQQGAYANGDGVVLVTP